MSITSPVDTKTLWRTELRAIGRLGFTCHIATEETIGGPYRYRAVCVLRPDTDRARRVCAAHGGTQIEGAQEFDHRGDVVFAHGDAMRAALQLARDAS